MIQAQKVNPAKDWNLGIALWTFHTMNFPQSLDHVDSTGLKFIEPNTFHETGPDFNHLIVSKLSKEQLEKLKQMVSSHGLKIESIYIAGGTTFQSWKEQFDIARQLGVKFVTAEPPLNLLDSVDHLAGEYHIKVAIHEHWKGMSIYWHPDSVLAALKGHPNFGACADLGHWPKSGINPVDGVKKLKGHIISIHLKDIAAYNNPKLVDVPVGTGVVDFPAVFQELKSQGFKGNIYIERDEVEKPSNLASVLKTIQYYNEQIGKLK
ncbi:MAG: sugar phosphate isomerase/epimerase family protein [Chitinophagaceae bacterium]